MTLCENVTFVEFVFTIAFVVSVLLAAADSEFSGVRDVPMDDW